MKPLINRVSGVFFIVILMLACQSRQTAEESQKDWSGPGQSAVTDDVSQQHIVQVASASPDHSTLVTAVQAAGLVDVLVNAGPFTVFAPINQAFDALPAGTVENLLKPENKSQLQNILEYHVFVGVITENMVLDGRTLNQVNLQNVTLSNKDGRLMVNDANITGSIRVSNGVIHVIDKVLIPG
ncbi:MAG TPA: fasciclin domain-containing protein [Saprospiraceae bacterium]|nr:fasciclin domain-containing protein [Saprospiraceae bacterium]